MLVNILVVCVAISFVVFIHELGHFFVARFFGVNIEKFSLGFGKEIWGFTRNKTRYCIAMFPFGGFVKMQGEDMLNKDDKKTEPGDFLGLGFLKRSLVVFAGPLMNVIFTFVVVFLLTVLVGVYSQNNKSLILGEVMKGSAAEISGLKAGDTLVAINNLSVKTWDDVFNITQNFDFRPAKITILRAGQNLEFSVIPRKESGRYILGIAPTFQVKKAGVIDGAKMTFMFIGNMTDMFWKLITSVFSKNSDMKNVTLVGPVGVIHELSTAIKQGWSQFFFLLALISFNLGLVNLLPLPILDGGHIFIYMVEGILKIKINRKVLEYAFSSMIVILLLLTFFVTNKDIIRIFGK